MFGRSYSAACMAQSVCHIHFGEKRKVIRKSTYITLLPISLTTCQAKNLQTDVIQVLSRSRLSITDFVIASKTDFVHLF